jgi:hypothetical protein
MTQLNFTSHKHTTIKLSEQVKNVLQEKGFSSLFNYSDYIFYKAQVKRAFNKAQAITELFIQDNSTSKSDFNGYIF